MRTTEPTSRVHLLDHFDRRLCAWLAERGEAAYRAGQVRRWVFERRADDFAAMTDLPAPLREFLAGDFRLWTTEVVKHQRADDGTEKLLLQLADGHRIECVLLRQGPQRRTICISTQVGCGMGCVFCASGLDGVARNLTTGEIVEQMLRLDRLLEPLKPGFLEKPGFSPAEAAAERLSHIVVMGMGEPLANLDNLLAALDDATNPHGLGIGARRITISTVGIPAAIRRLAEKDLQFHLAVSLHAADDELRNHLVPVNAKIGLAAILEAADDYFAATGRRLTFEYVLLGGINDRPSDARKLAAFLRDKTALVNVIPYNPVAGLPYQTPTAEAVSRFTSILEQAGVAIRVRRRKGDKIDAACGQLRRAAAATPLSLADQTAAPAPAR